MTGGLYRADTAYITATDSGAAIVGSVVRAASAIGLKDCLFHADGIVDATGQAHIIELSGRPSGMNISAKLLPLAMGVDIVAAAISHLRGEAPFPSAPMNVRPAALVYFPFGEGCVESVGAVKEPAQWDGVVELNCPLKIGDHLRFPTGCADFLKRGYALLKANDEPSLLALMLRLEKFMIEEVRIGRE